MRRSRSRPTLPSIALLQHRVPVMPVDQHSLAACLLIPVITAVFLAVFLFLWTSLGIAVVRNDSMSPTFVDGDRILILRRWPAKWLRRGCVVLISLHQGTITGSESYISSDVYIKRIVGLPGDEISTSIDELPAFLRSKNIDEYDETGFRSWHIPPAHFFVRGDKSQSFDSQVWGPVTYASLQGVVIKKLRSATRTVTKTAQRQ
jgi:signal peptidase I